MYLQRNQINAPRKKGLQTLILISVFLLLFTVLIQLYIMSEYATAGAEITKLEQRKTELVSENLQMQRDIAEARNLNYIKEKNEDQGYVAFTASEVKYIKIGTMDK